MKSRAARPVETLWMTNLNSNRHSEKKRARMSKLASIHSGEDLLHKPGFRFISLFSVPRIISLLVLVSALTAQVAERQTRVGFPQDWTHRHVVFHRQML